MNEAILKRARLWTVAAGALLSLVCLFAVSFRFAAGLLVTAIWAAAGFYVLERLLRAVVVPPGTPRHGLAALGWGAAKLAIYGLAVAALIERPFPPVSHLIGFSLLLVALVAAGVSARPRDGGQPLRRGDDG